jgi:hypothetical protein
VRRAVPGGRAVSVTAVVSISATSGPVELNLEGYCGDEFTLTLPFEDEDTGQPIDLTTDAWAGFWKSQMRRRHADGVAAEFDIDTEQLTNGILVLGIAGDVMETLDGIYGWDLQLTYPDGVPMTIFAGTFHASLDWTH